MESILKISEAVSLGLHASAIIAGASGEKVSVTAIAEKLEASEAHLSKVLQRLSKAGLVDSSRGPKGGFVLSRPAAEITLLDIYRAIEGEFPSKSCLYSKTVCGRSTCVLGDLISRLNHEVFDYLSKKTLADVVE